MEMLKHEVLQVPRSEGGSDTSSLPPVKLFEVVSRGEEGQKCGGIGRSLVFIDEPRGFDKDLPHVERLPSITLKFTKESAAAGSKFAGYLKFRRKAAIVDLNKHQWRGYLYPTRVDPHEGLQCHYEMLPNSPMVKHEPVRCSSSKPFGVDGGGWVPPPVEDPIRDVFEEQDSNAQSSILGSGAAAAVNSSHTPILDDGSTVSTRATSTQITAEIARFYNNFERECEADSYVYHMKRFNNFVKSVLIDQAVEDAGRGRKRRGHPGGQLRVLDLACGKGGDLGKWIRNKTTFYVGMDVAQQSLNSLIERISAGSGWGDVPVVLIAGDLLNISSSSGNAPLIWTSKNKRWRQDEEVTEQLSHSQFDIVSMQFALHYMAETEDTMRTFLFFVASKLRPGGQFIATTVDARVLCEMLMGHSEDTNGGASRECSPKDKKGRELLRITSPGDVFTRILRKNANVPEKSESSFGIMYNFTLVEKPLEDSTVNAVVNAPVNAPEFLLPLPDLSRLAAEAGLDLVAAENFHEFYEKRTSDRNMMDMVHRLHVTNYRGCMDECEWAISRFYIALTFRRRDTNNDKNNLVNGGNVKQQMELNRHHEQQLVSPSLPSHSSSSKLCFIPPLFCPPKFEPSMPDRSPPNWHLQTSPPSPKFYPSSPTRQPLHSRSSQDVGNRVEQDNEAWPASPTAPPESPLGSPPPLVIIDGDQQRSHSIVSSKRMNIGPTTTVEKGDDDPEEWEAMEMLRVIKDLKRKYGEEVWAKLPLLQRDAEVKVELEKRRGGNT